MKVALGVVDAIALAQGIEVVFLARVFLSRQGQCVNNATADFLWTWALVGSLESRG